eukprot:941111-Prymnesium_polylepis.2
MAVAAAVVRQLDHDSLWQAHLDALTADEVCDEIQRVSAQLAEAQAAKAACESRRRAQLEEVPSSFLAAAAVRTQDAYPAAQVAAPKAETLADGWKAETLADGAIHGLARVDGDGDGDNDTQGDEADGGTVATRTGAVASDAPRSAAYPQRLSRARTASDEWLREEAASSPARCNLAPAPGRTLGSTQRSLVGAALVIGFASIAAVRVLRR